MEPQSTQEKLMKCFFRGGNNANAMAGLDSDLTTTPGTSVVLYERQSGTPLSIRHTGGSTDLLRYRMRGV